MISTAMNFKQQTSNPVARTISALLFSISLLGVPSLSAQSLGDLARQERARSRKNGDSSTHVFTNEDLARPRILAGVSQEDSQDRTQTANSSVAPVPPTAMSKQPTAIPVPVWPEGTPLGDVARYYRELRDLRAAPQWNEALAQDSAEVNAAPPFLPGKQPKEDVLRTGQPPQKPKEVITVPQPGVRDSNPSPRVVRVHRGDSLWKIAHRYLGDGNQWQDLAAANPEIADPNLIHVGQQIRLPGETAAEVAAAAPDADQVRVQNGDSLWKIAASHLGDGMAWSCIAASNPQIQDASKIFPGQTITLPSRCSLSI